MVWIKKNIVNKNTYLKDLLKTISLLFHKFFSFIFVPLRRGGRGCLILICYLFDIHVLSLSLPPFELNLSAFDLYIKKQDVIKYSLDIHVYVSEATVVELVNM